MSRYTTVPKDLATPCEIGAMPALLTTYQYARIAGQTPNRVTKRCKDGELPAVKVGGRWRINKAKALRALGL